MYVRVRVLGCVCMWDRPLGDGCGNKAHFFWLDLTMDFIMVEGQGLDPMIIFGVNISPL